MKKILGVLIFGILAFNMSYGDPIKSIIRNYNYGPQDSIRQVIRNNVSSLRAVPASYDYSSSYNMDSYKLYLYKLDEVAAKYIGVPYVFGGTSYSGMDCSGFVMRVFQQLGVRLPRTASEQSRLGKLVLHKLRPGDLLFFRDTYKPGISHVGIYIGHGKMIDASSVYHRVVVESIVNNPYFNAHFAFAKRILSY